MFLRQLGDRLDLLRVERREGDVSTVAARQVDDLDADRGVVDIAAGAPLAGAGMPSALVLIHQVENAHAAEASGLIGGFGRIRHQIVCADRFSGQRLHRVGEVLRRVVQHQKAHAVAEAGDRSVAIVINLVHHKVPLSLDFTERPLIMTGRPAQVNLWLTFLF